jgi:hypothetical protein
MIGGEIGGGGAGEHKEWLTTKEEPVLAVALRLPAVEAGWPVPAAAADAALAPEISVERTVTSAMRTAARMRSSSTYVRCSCSMRSVRLQAILAIKSLAQLLDSALLPPPPPPPLALVGVALGVDASSAASRAFDAAALLSAAASEGVVGGASLSYWPSLRNRTTHST